MKFHQAFFVSWVCFITLKGWNLIEDGELNQEVFNTIFDVSYFYLSTVILYVVLLRQNDPGVYTEKQVRTEDSKSM